MEGWNNGRMEEWEDKEEWDARFYSIPTFQYSNSCISI